MADNRITFKVSPDLRKFFQREADKKQWTLSYYIENICKEYANKKLTKSK